MAGSRAEALVVRAKVRGASGDADQGESFLWQDMISHRFGKTVWVMELDVHRHGATPYRVQDEFKVPNKLFKARYLLKARPQFGSGLALPVTVDDRDPAKLTIEWDVFEARGGVGQLYAHEERVSDSIRDFVADIRSTPTTPEPNVPRPTSVTHPPVEGVDYDRWVGAALSVTRRLKPAALESHYQSHGFPAGRGNDISAAWYARVQSDPVVNAWFLYDQANR